MKHYTTILILFISLKGFPQQKIFLSSGEDIYSFDLFNCTSHLVGAVSLGFLDIALTPDGRLWGIDGGLYQIDTINAATTYIG